MKPQKILLIDDRDHELYRIHIENAGYDIHAVSSGHEGLTWLETNHADIVITDLAMPTMDGLTFLERLLPGNHRILVVSGYFVNGMIEKLLKDRCGVERVIEKGADIEAFMRKLGEWIG